MPNKRKNYKRHSLTSTVPLQAHLYISHSTKAMGKPLYTSLLLARRASEGTVKPQPPKSTYPVVEKWSRWNVFDPDSDEFFEADNAVYEAFEDPPTRARTLPRGWQQTPNSLRVGSGTFTSPRARWQDPPTINTTTPSPAAVSTSSTSSSAIAVNSASRPQTSGPDAATVGSTVANVQSPLPAPSSAPRSSNRSALSTNLFAEFFDSVEDYLDSPVSFDPADFQQWLDMEPLN